MVLAGEIFGFFFSFSYSNGESSKDLHVAKPLSTTLRALVATSEQTYVCIQCLYTSIRVAQRRPDREITYGSLLFRSYRSSPSQDVGSTIASDT